MDGSEKTLPVFFKVQGQKGSGCRGWRKGFPCLVFARWLRPLIEGFLGGTVVKNPSAVQESQEMWVQSLGGEDPLAKEMATRPSVLA